MKEILSKIIIRKGAGTPPALDVGEFGLDTTNNKLYIGTAEGINREVVGSNIDPEQVAQISTNEADIANLKTDKQDKLVAGENITINPDTNVISASGGIETVKVNGVALPVSSKAVDITIPEDVVKYTSDNKINIKAWDTLVDDDDNPIFGLDKPGVVYLPKYGFDSITRTVVNNVASYKMVMMYFENGGQINVTNIILKWNTELWGNTVDFMKGTIRSSDNYFIIDTVTVVKSVTLTPDMLAPQYGENVYIIPYSSAVLDYVPCIPNMYFDTQPDGEGFIAHSRYIYEQRVDYTRSMGIGWSDGPIVGRENVMDTVIRLEDKIERYKTESNLRNVKIGFLGDSITFNGQYTTALQEQTGCIVANYGVSGAHIVQRNEIDSSSFDVRFSDMDADCKMVVVFGGTNDFGHESTAPWGLLTDGIDSAKMTFQAGLHRLFRGLYLKFLGKPIAVITPLHRQKDPAEFVLNEDGTMTVVTNVTTGKTLKQYVEAIKEIAAVYSITILDAYSFSGMTPFPEGTYTTTHFQDSLHLSTAGGEKLAKWLRPQLEELYKQYE